MGAKGKPSVASEIGPLTTQSPSGTLSYPPTQPPPSFDSFPDIALSSLSLATAPPIPSFSSFPDITPPSTSTPEISPKDDSSKSKKKHKKDSKEKSKRNRSIKRKKSRKDDDDSWIERRAQEKQEGQRQPSSFARAADKKHKPGEWILDVRGDPNMLRYGLSQYETPSYVRHGGGRVLGCPPHWRIDYAQTKANGGLIVMREGRMPSKVKRYTDPNATWKDRSQEYRRITRAKAEELAKTLGLDQEDPAYISLDIRKAPTKDRDSDSESESDSDIIMSGKSVDYRDIHGKSVYKDQDDDLMQTTSDQEEEGAESALDALQRRRTLLDAELRKEPKDSRKWLEFISIADDIDLVTSRRSVVGVSAHSAGHAEVKLSYFDRALLHNPTDERLLLEYMNCYRQAYSSPKVLAKWDELLQSSQIRSAWPGLWIEYLDYRQRHQLSFSVNNFVSVAQEALESLSSVARMLWSDNRRNKADLEVRNRLVRFESVMVHVIVRVCALLKQAGYIERAQAILQGEMEFLFSIPADLVDEPFDTRLGELEDYWDKEQPRFGEKDAKGWTHYFTAKEVADVEYLLDTVTLPVKDDPMDDLFRPFVEADKDRFEFGRWARMEKEVNAACWFPIRTSEVDTMPAQLEDDPYGIIMFDDIQPFIADLHTMEARMQFVDCMFHFQGLPVSLIAGSNGLSHQRRSTSTEQVKPRGVGSYNPYFHDSLLLNVGLDSTYSTEENNPGLGRVFPSILTAARAEEIVRKEIELSIKDCELEEENWSCVWNLPLKVFTQGTDAIFGKHVGSEKKNHRYPWASVSSHDEVQQFNKEFVRNPDTEVESGELQDQSVLNESVNMRSILLPAHLNPTSGPAASKESKKGPKRKICTATEAEMLWIQLAKMVYFHSIRAGESLREGQSFGAGFQPRALRRIVHSGLERFPNCSILQSLYFWTEAKQRVHGRVRTWVNDQVTQTLSGAPSRTGYPPADKNVLWMFGLYYELWHQDTYNVHTIRTMLESALESSSKATSFSSSPNLWLIYLELEIRESIRQKSFRDLGQDTKRSSSSSTSKDIDAEFGTRIKGLLHRALADCPWYKDLYLFAFEPRVRSLFSLEELEALYETMLAKEIRVRQELPERVSREIDMDREGDVVMTGA
ncbi:hypothetical protein BGZ52_010549 [Haplosporangium bisporale]|nr:hypothetical protein BGZ52_010549 [Haplosporangium bisporale]